MDLLTEIKNKQALVGIIGLGYVGLPLVLRFCQVGYQVLGFDTDSKKVDLLNRGDSYIKHIPSSRLSELTRQQDGERQFAATPDVDMTSIPLTAENLQQADPVLLVTDHSAYDYAWIASQARLIADTRNAFKGQPGNHIFQV